MRIVFLDRSGYPVERHIGRPIQNFLRLLLHTRRVAFLTVAVAVLLTGCSALPNLTPHFSFGSTPVGTILCPAIKAKANMEIANQAICRNPATTALCLAAQVAADQAVMLACGPDIATLPPAQVAQVGRTAASPRASSNPTTAPVQQPMPTPTQPEDDPRIALQRVYESIGMTPMQAARKSMELGRVSVVGVPK